MSTTTEMNSLRIALVMAALIAISSLARSDGISLPGFISDGVTGGISARSGAGTTGCLGVIDASAGCPLPMLGS